MKKNIVKILAVILCSVCFVAYKFFNATKVEDTSTKNIKQNIYPKLLEPPWTLAQIIEINGKKYIFLSSSFLYKSYKNQIVKAKNI